MIKRKWIAGAALVVGMSLGIGIGSLRAAGVPQTEPLFYSGTITESGLPVTGTRDVSVSLWTDETSTDANAHRKCESVADGTVVEEGRFRVVLNAACGTAIHANPDMWVRVQVGDTVLPRAKVGAVPFALESDRATLAAAATTADQAAVAQLANDSELLEGSPASAFAAAGHTHPASEITGAPIITAWTDYTPEMYLGTPSTVVPGTKWGSYRRVGDTLHVKITAGIPSNDDSTTSIVEFGLPNGYQAAVTPSDTIGGAAFIESSTGGALGCVVRVTAGGQSIFLVCDSPFGNLQRNELGPAPDYGGIYMQFEVRIQDWTLTSP